MANAISEIKVTKRIERYSPVKITFKMEICSQEVLKMKLANSEVFCRSFTKGDRPKKMREK